MINRGREEGGWEGRREREVGEMLHEGVWSKPLIVPLQVDDMAIHS